MSYNGGVDIIVTKLNASGSALIYSTFLGGSGNDNTSSIALDGDGNAFIIGQTKSNDFPTTSGAYDDIYDGDGDVFVTKLNTSGSALIYSTFIGGSGADAGCSIALDGEGNAFITGSTGSSSFPTTISAYDRSFNGNDDVFVTTLNASGSALIYSTFLGGSLAEQNSNISLTGSGNAFISGMTSSTDFPTTSGAYDESYNGGNQDIFIAKLYEDRFPALISPENNAINQPVNPIMSWQTVSDAISYTFQISLVPNFVTTVINQSGITDTSFYAYGLSYGTQYYWRVQAVTDMETCPWSEVWNFTTIQLNIPWVIESDSTGNNALIIVLTSINPTIY